MPNYPNIGSRYTGPALDKPSLRKMPEHWQLATEEDAPTKLEVALYAGAALLGAWLLTFTFFSLGVSK